VPTRPASTAARIALSVVWTLTRPGHPARLAFLRKGLTAAPLLSETEKKNEQNRRGGR
jgi:hypothetical protein